MRIGAIIQARMGSTRLPGKVMKYVGGRSVLDRVLSRVCRADIDHVVAIHHDPLLVNHLHTLGYNYVSTNSSLYTENDVLSRFWEVTNSFDGRYSFDTIVRVTSDCPLIDSTIISRVIQNFISGGYDYYSNCRPASTYPDGMDVEVFTYEALKIANREARGKEREHVTPYIWNHPHEFKIGRLVSPVDLSRYRMTLDTPEDLDYIRRVYQDLGDNFSLDDILKLPYNMVRSL